MPKNKIEVENQGDYEPSGIPSNNGGGDYESIIEQLKADGIPIANGDKIASEGFQWTRSSTERLSAIHYIAAVAKAERINANKEAKLALLLDLEARAVFKNRKERIAFNEYVQDCVTLKIPLDNAIRQLVGSVSEGGMSRQELLGALTSFQYTHRTYDYGYSKTKKSNGSNPGITR